MLCVGCLCSATKTELGSFRDRIRRILMFITKNPTQHSTPKGSHFFAQYDCYKHLIPSGLA